MHSFGCISTAFFSHYVSEHGEYLFSLDRHNAALFTFPHIDPIGKQMRFYTVDSQLLQCLQKIDGIFECIGRLFNDMQNTYIQMTNRHWWHCNDVYSTVTKKQSLWLKFHLARLDSTHSTCRAHAFWLCRASRTAQLDSLDTTSSTGSTRRARLARHVELDRRYLQLSYDHRNSFIV